MKHFDEIQALSFRLKSVEERLADLQKFDRTPIETGTGEIAPLLSQVERSYYWCSQVRKQYIFDWIRKLIGEQLELELGATRAELSKYEIHKIN